MDVSLPCLFSISYFLHFHSCRFLPALGLGLGLNFTVTVTSSHRVEKSGSIVCIAGSAHHGTQTYIHDIREHQLFHSLHNPYRGAHHPSEPSPASHTTTTSVHTSFQHHHLQCTCQVRCSSHVIEVVCHIYSVANATSGPQVSKPTIDPNTCSFVLLAFDFD